MKRILIALAVAAVCAVAYDASHRDPSGFIYREYTITRPFLSTGTAIPFWEFIGNAVVTDDYIRLTPDRQSKRGAMWSTKQCHLSEWEITIQFKVHGQGKHLFGDGFAFYYTADRATLGPVFGNKDYFIGLGIFFDTYNNHPQAHQHGHPFISGLVNDGTISYDHDSGGTHEQIAGCQSFFRNAEHDTLVRIVYRGRTLKVLIDTEDDEEWEPCFIVPDVYLPAGYYFGLSAATGELADNHDILGVRVSDPGALSAEELEEEEQMKMRQMFHQRADDSEEDFQKVHHEQPFAKHHEPRREHIDDEPSEGSSFTTVLIVLGLLVVVVAGGFGYMKMQESKNKRFSY